MLKDFWKLNSPFSIISTQDNLQQLLKNSRHLCNILYEPEEFCPTSDYPTIKIRDTIFENISFSKTTFKNVLFNNCTFKSCLFVGSAFFKCRINNCKFEDVNMSYCSFTHTYIHPDTLKNIFPKEYANLAVSFYQGLFNSLKEDNQSDRAVEAEFYFRHWNKIHNYARLKKICTDNKIYSAKVLSQFFKYAILLFWSLFGYGIRIRQYLLTTTIAFIIFFTLNFYFWSSILPSQYFGSPPTEWHHILFFTFYSFTSIGSTPMAPISSLGVILVIVEGVVGWFLLGVGIAILVKKIVR